MVIAILTYIHAEIRLKFFFSVQHEAWLQFLQATSTSALLCPRVAYDVHVVLLDYIAALEVKRARDDVGRCRAEVLDDQATMLLH